jgi:hypothetical protein
MDGRPFFVLSCAVDPGLLTNVARADCPTAQGRWAQRFVDMPRRTRGRRIPTSFGSFHAGLANKLGKNKTMGKAHHVSLLLRQAISIIAHPVLGNSGTAPELETAWRSLVYCLCAIRRAVRRFVVDRDT